MNFFSLLGLIMGAFFIGAIRTIQDARLIQTIACPAANANLNSATLDLGTGPHVADIEIQISIPATPSLVDAHAITMTLMHSADDITYVAIPELAPLVVTGAGGVGAAALTDSYRLPSSTQRYVQLNIAVANGGGNNTAISVTLSPLM
jgi:hypothetical protein